MAQHPYSKLTTIPTLKGGMMARPHSQKLTAATELWQTMPTAKLIDFVKAFKKLHGYTISVPSAHLAKKRAGFSKARNRSSEGKVVGIEQLKLVNQLAQEMGGIKEVRRQLNLLAAIAKAAGGYDQLGRCLEMIVELKK